MLNEKTLSKPLRIMVFLILLFFTFSPLAFSYDVPTTAQPLTDDLGNLGTVLTKIIGFFSSGYMKAICTIALGGLGIGMIMNRGEPGMVKKFIPWVAGATLMLSLSTITSLIFNPTTTTR